MLLSYADFRRSHAPHKERTPAALAVPLKLTRNAADTAYLPDASGASGASVDAKVRARLTPVARRRAR